MQPPKPLSKSALKALTKEWYGKLAATGFVDLERGLDLNGCDTGSTFRRPTSAGGHGMEVILVDPGPSTDHTPSQANGLGRMNGQTDPALWQTQSALEIKSGAAEGEQARLWMRLAQSAHDLPVSFRWRELLIDLANGMGQVAAADKHGISRGKCVRVLRIFCEVEGFDYARVFRSARPRIVVEKQAPAPVRKLSRREIRGLGYAPPKRIAG